MASVIKSLDVESASYALGAKVSVRQPGVDRNAMPVQQESSTPPRLDDSAQVTTEQAARDAARQVEEEIRRRVDDALRQKLEMLQKEQASEEKAHFVAAAERGYEEGMQKAADELAAQQRALEDRLALLEKNIGAALDKALADTTAVACEIAFETVLKILGREIASGEAVAALTREVAVRTDASGEILLRVNPEDAKLLSRRSDAIPPRYRLEPDASLTRGGCVIETVHGIVDARLETRLDAFVEALRGTPSEHPEALP